RSDAVHAVVLVAAQTATAFSSLAFDLTYDERKTALAKGEAALSQLEARSEQVEPIVKEILSSDDHKQLVNSVMQIRRSWEEIKTEIAQGGHDIFKYHLMTVVEHTERLREVIEKADESAKASARAAASALNE